MTTEEMLDRVAKLQKVAAILGRNAQRLEDELRTLHSDLYSIHVDEVVESLK